jgi:hypothetical protein
LPADTLPSRNLLILHTDGAQDIADWLAIKKQVEARAPDIEVRIAAAEAVSPVTRRWQVRRPSLVFCPVHALQYRPRGGTLCAGRNLDKMEQAGRFAAAGLPAPKTRAFQAGMTIDPDEWGPYLVVKPIRGSHGVNVRLARTADVAQMARGWDPKLDPQIILQEFIDHTDDAGHLADHRVITMLGRPLMVQRRRLIAPRPPIETLLRDTPAGIAMNSVSHRRTRDYVDAPDVYEFATRIAAAFGDVACLGIDIIRERATGKLYVLEVNPGGNVWQFSSDFTKENWLPEERAGAYAQFNALELAADLLIARTRAEAS